MNSYCGVDCDQCPLLQAGKVKGKERKRIQLEAQKSWSKVLSYEINEEELLCLGCKSNVKYQKCMNCDIEKCCKEKKLDNCFECSEYPCQRIMEFKKYIDKNRNYLFKEKW